MDCCKYLLMLLILLGFTHCGREKDDQNNSKDILKVDELKLRKENVDMSKEWACHYIEEENRICVPINWKPVNQSKTFYFSYLDNSNTNTYFAISRYSLKSRDISYEYYLKEAYSVLKKDTIELGQGYTVKKLIFSDREYYYCEFYTALKGKPYVTYSMLFKKNDFLYEIGLKAEQAQKDKYYNIFQSILYNIHIGKDVVFSEKDELETIQIVNLDTL